MGLFRPGLAVGFQISSTLLPDFHSKQMVFFPTSQQRKVSLSITPEPESRKEKIWQQNNSKHLWRGHWCHSEEQGVNDKEIWFSTMCLPLTNHLNLDKLHHFMFTMYKTVYNTVVPTYPWCFCKF